MFITQNATSKYISQELVAQSYFLTSLTEDNASEDNSLVLPDTFNINCVDYINSPEEFQNLIEMFNLCDYLGFHEICKKIQSRTRAVIP